jgi:hypothetical protein
MIAPSGRSGVGCAAYWLCAAAQPGSTGLIVV